MEEAALQERLRAFDATPKPLSLYLHIPFCKTMCLFCGCSVVLNRRPEKQTAYLEWLHQEIALTASSFRTRRHVSQLHLGGGTPTSLSVEEFERLMQTLRASFSFEADAELSIEVDPRTVSADGGEKLRALRALGFNRVSFGVQDLDPRVQEAVKRRQSRAMTVETYERAKELGFGGINIDLIYGLPLQTAASFRETARALIELLPDRISLFSYARLPWLKKHQNAIREEDLPSPEEKIQIYLEARAAFLEAGYVPIGMDHFARPTDSLFLAYAQGTLHRNFQGYSVGLAEDILGFGMTAIGFLEGVWFQNVKSIDEYSERLKKGHLPVFRGFVLKPEDILRRWVIQRWMCSFHIDKREFQVRFGVAFDVHFAREESGIRRLCVEGLVEESGETLQATPHGQLFIRLIAAVFDQYLTEYGRFSSVV